MDAIVLIERFLRNLRDRREQLENTLIAGGIKNMEDYKKIVGEISGLNFAESLIIDLQGGEEQKDGS